uniref:Uncharacterized protein n=1 Tax=Arundo donax TaxID=35708 RepID=A0A0A8ZGQ6_ARUDO
MDNSLGILVIQPLFSKLLQQMIYEFGMHSLGCLGLIMTPMSCKDLLCLQG